MAQEKGKGKTSRGGGFRQVADRSRPLVEKAAGRHGFAQADVLLRWAEIAGEALAATCRPVRVTYGADRRLGATLVVQAGGARAPEVEHLAPRIIERINQFYGYRAIARLRITQTGAAGIAGPARVHDAPAVQPTGAETERAVELTRDVQDADLRSALTRLGANVLARGRGGAPAK